MSLFLESAAFLNMNAITPRANLSSASSDRHVQVEYTCCGTLDLPLFRSFVGSVADNDVGVVVIAAAAVVAGVGYLASMFHAQHEPQCPASPCHPH